MAYKGDNMISYLGHEISWLPKLEKNKKEALYKQIAESIKRDIESGNLPTGFKLPPQRLIANYLKINHSTVTKAYKLCESQGLIKGVTGKGTFVNNTSGIPQSILEKEEVGILDMAMLHPLYETNDILAKMIESLTPHMDHEIMYRYSSAMGHEKHKYIASKWLKHLNIHCTPEKMLITSGGQNALMTVLMTEFQSGDKIIVDMLTYPGIRNAALQLDLTLIPVESDHEGMSVNHLEKILLKEDVKGIYLMPDCQNPRAVTMGYNRRKDIADLIEQYGLLLIEDSVFRFTENLTIPTLHSLTKGRSYHIFSIAKMINPGFRISYLLVPDHANLKKLEHTLHNMIFMPSSITAEMVSALQSSNKLHDLMMLRMEHLKRKNDIFDSVFNIEDRDAHHNPMYRFIELNTNEIDLENLFKQYGIQVYDCNRFKATDTVSDKGIRISLTAQSDDRNLKDALIQIKRVIDKHNLL